MRICLTVIVVTSLVARGAAHASAAASLEQSAADVRSTLRELRVLAAALPVGVEAVEPASISHDLDCTEFIFEANSPPVSPPETLLSRTWMEECERLPLPGGGCIPRRRQIGSYEKTVRVELLARESPGPREVFEVCLRGPWLSLRVRSSPHGYDVQERDGHFTLKRKQPATMPR